MARAGQHRSKPLPARAGLFRANYARETLKMGASTVSACERSEEVGGRRCSTVLPTGAGRCPRVSWPLPVSPIGETSLLPSAQDPAGYGYIRSSSQPPWLCVWRGGHSQRQNRQECGSYVHSHCSMLLCQRVPLRTCRRALRMPPVRLRHTINYWLYVQQRHGCVRQDFNSSTHAICSKHNQLVYRKTDTHGPCL
jgi:hypothetical protein